MTGGFALPRILYIRRPGIATVAKVIAVGTIAIGGIAGGTQIFHGGGSTGSGTGNVFLDAAGSDFATNCQRYSSRTDPGGQVCGTFDKAYSLAQTGDTVLIRGGTFTSSQAITAAHRKADGSSCSYLGITTGCITFQPETGQTVTFNATNLPTSSPGNPSVQLQLNCADYVRLKNITFTERDFTDTLAGGTDSHTAFSAGQSDDTCKAVGPPHDDIFENLTVGGAGNMTSGIYNSCLVNSHAVSAKNQPWHFSQFGYNNDGSGANAHDNCMIGNTFDGFNFTDNNSLHMECVTMFTDTTTPFPPGGMSNNIIRNNKFLDCPAGVEGFFMQIDSPAVANNNLFEGNVFTGSAAFPLKISCHSTGGTVTNTTVRFNTFYGNNATWDRNGTCSESGNVSYGNLNADCPASPQATSSRNVFTAASCATDNGTSSFSATPAYTNTGTYDFSLANCTQTAANFATPAQVVGYPSLDPNGITRPQGAGLDAGAFESCSNGAAPQFGASLATCSPAPCTAGLAPTSGSGTAYPTTAGPVSGAVNEVSVGNVNDGVFTTPRGYAYYKPTNLTGAAAVMMVAAGTNGLCGVLDPPQSYAHTHWHTVADQNSLIIVFLAKTYNGTSCTSLPQPINWRTPNIVTNTSGTGDQGAGAASDEPYITAVVNSVLNIPSDHPTWTADSQRLYITGASGGGWLTHDVMCDTTNRAKFRGFAPVSDYLRTAETSQNGPLNPGTEKCSPPGTGVGTGYNGGSSSPAGRSFFYQLTEGVLDGSVPFQPTTCQSNNCFAGWTDQNTFMRTYMGCNATPTVTLIGTPTAENELDDYGSCTFGINAPVELVKVPHGCHSWEGLDADPEGSSASTCSGNPLTNPTNGFDSAAQTWAFFSTRQW